MSMTREEIIKEYETAVAAHAAAAAAEIKGAEKSYELFKAGLDALRPVSREKAEKVWRGEWKGVPKLGIYDMACSKCGYSPGIRFYSSEFCPNCGAPMTDEAVEMVMERLEKLKNEIG